MTESTLVWAWMGLAVATFVVLLFRVAPYGRHLSTGWGPTIGHRMGWIIMECVSPLALLVAAGGRIQETAHVLLVGLWIVHYLHRAIIYPFRARWKHRQMPIIIMLSAVVFNMINGGLNGWGMSHVQVDGFWSHPMTWIGLALFVGGATLNVVADQTLFSLRKENESGVYQVPHGGLYRWITCPNYLGEIIEWIGFALIAGTIESASFAVWTVANLVPRAIQHHRWYRATFDDYPERRKAVFPGML